MREPLTQLCAQCVRDIETLFSLYKADPQIQYHLVLTTITYYYHLVT